MMNETLPSISLWAHSHGTKRKKAVPALDSSNPDCATSGDRSTDWYTFRCSRRVDEARAFFLLRFLYL